jgi:hypothetical protein
MLNINDETTTQENKCFLARIPGSRNEAEIDFLKEEFRKIYYNMLKMVQYISSNLSKKTFSNHLVCIRKNEENWLITFARSSQGALTNLSFTSFSQHRTIEHQPIGNARWGLGNNLNFDFP